MPATTGFGYGSTGHPETFHCPAFTIEARYERAVKVRWVNQLVDRSGGYLPHLLPVDPTLHWANPSGGAKQQDSHTRFTSTPGPYGGPVPVVTHLHGGANTEESEGYAEAWYLPDAQGIPRGYAGVGSFYVSAQPDSRPEGHWNPPPWTHGTSGAGARPIWHDAPESATRRTGPLRVAVPRISR